MALNHFRHLSKLVLIVTMVISLFAPISQQKANAEGVLKVTEAIANNTGTATVEGYIVGTVKGGTGSSISYQFEGPFTQDTNLALADSPNETDKTKILAVQLPGGAVREALNLKAHSENLKKKIQITGDLLVYFGVPGHKNAKSFSFVSGIPAEPQAEVVTASIPQGVISKGTTVTLETKTEGAAIYYTLDGTVPTKESKMYSDPITINEDTTIKAIAIKDKMKDSRVSEFVYNVAISGLRIHDIQGESHNSPVDKKYVEGVTGIVTYVADADNFYLQDTQPDENEKTSEGILVYKKGHGVAKGDIVTVAGQVKEWVLEGYSDKMKTDLAVTEINATNTLIKLNSSGNALPEAVTIGEGGRQQPTEIIDNDNFGLFDPQQDGIDFYESLEGMLVKVDNPSVIAPQKNGEIVVVPDIHKNKEINEAGGLNITANDFNPERLFIDMNDYSFVAKTGDYFVGSITGVVSYGYGNFKVLTNRDDLPQFVEGTTERETSDFHEKHKELTIASFNVENFSADENGTSDEKVTRIAGSIVTNLKSPDIVGLVEMQDGNGALNNGNTDAKESADRLIAEIAAQGGPNYVYTDVAPENNKDGGQPGGNIRVGYIYNPERVKLAEGVKGTATQAVTFKNGKLTANPGRIDPTNAAFASSRKPLAAQFEFNGETVVVVANHFNSKGGDQPLFGKNQPPYLKSEEQRHQIAGIVNNFVKEVKADDPNAKVVLLGDFNDFEFSKTFDILKGSELTNMIDEVPFKERFTYSYQGNAQVLDHILVTNNMAKKTKVDIVHINSQFMEEHGRASDHDPVIVQIKLDKVKDVKVK
ncbi:DUF6359 domain-containing protein [Fictibacillus iocasae]|uniref:DUF6359 domain-containing protein n=1 Tax=Fictibacillus iocasae TaxID=2715437 RepID=A0ABW2NIN8_9BACL